MIYCNKECEMNENGACYASNLLILSPKVSGLICYKPVGLQKAQIPLEFWTCGNEECNHWFQLKSYKEEGYTLGHCDLDKMIYTGVCQEYCAKG